MNDELHIAMLAVRLSFVDMPVSRSKQRGGLIPWK